MWLLSKGGCVEFRKGNLQYKDGILNFYAKIIPIETRFGTFYAAYCEDNGLVLYGRTAEEAEDFFKDYVHRFMDDWKERNEKGS